MKKSILEIDEMIRSLEEKKSKIQGKCKHSNVVTKYCGDTGNYDPSSDGYWKEKTCPDCGKHWIEDE